MRLAALTRTKAHTHRTLATDWHTTNCWRPHCAAIFCCVRPRLVAISHGVKAQHVDAGCAVHGEVQIVSGHPTVVFWVPPLEGSPVTIRVVTLIRLTWKWEKEPKAPNSNHILARACLRIASLARVLPHSAAAGRRHEERSFKQ